MKMKKGYYLVSYQYYLGSTHGFGQFQFTLKEAISPDVFIENVTKDCEEVAGSDNLTLIAVSKLA